ncbi:hypothetical protein OQA88_4304 [Cercophora sp. LCS_1]
MGIHLEGRCVCKNLQYSLDLDSPEDARTTLCHCSSCRRAFGTNYGLTAKVPIQAFKYEQGAPKTHKQENGVVREFCDNCGAFICEYGVCLAMQSNWMASNPVQEQAAGKFRYIMWGTLDEPDKIPPRGEFYCRNRTERMPEIPGRYLPRWKDLLEYTDPSRCFPQEEYKRIGG